MAPFVLWNLSYATEGISVPVLLLTKGHRLLISSLKVVRKETEIKLPICMSSCCLCPMASSQLSKSLTLSPASTGSGHFHKAPHTRGLSLSSIFYLPSSPSFSLSLSQYFTMRSRPGLKHKNISASPRHYMDVLPRLCLASRMTLDHRIDSSTSSLRIFLCPWLKHRNHYVFGSIINLPMPRWWWCSGILP